MWGHFSGSYLQHIFTALYVILVKNKHSVYILNVILFSKDDIKLHFFSKEKKKEGPTVRFHKPLGS